MKILLASPRGFCAGVDMAVEALGLALERYGAPLYAYHQIVHNTHIVRSFEQRGVTFVDDVADVPFGGTVVFSAHGVSPQVRKEAADRSLTVVDATCPLVSKVHAEARRFGRKGPVILIGHHGHDETVGVTGEAPDAMTVIESEEALERLDLPELPVAFLTQTTLGVAETARLERAIRERFPGILGPPTQDICYATENRQRAVKAVALESEVVLVLGSENSSNSKRLVEVATAAGTRAYLVDHPDLIERAWVEGVRTLGLSAGASVPEMLVRDTLRWMSERHPVDAVEELVSATETVVFRVPSELR